MQLFALHVLHDDDELDVSVVQDFYDARHRDVGMGPDHVHRVRFMAYQRTTERCPFCDLCHRVARNFECSGASCRPTFDREERTSISRGVDYGIHDCFVIPFINFCGLQRCQATIINMGASAYLYRRAGWALRIKRVLQEVGNVNKHGVEGAL